MASSRKTAIKAIDAHVHLYPDSIALKVTPALSARFGNPPSFDGTIQGCRKKDEEARIAISVNLPVATKPDSVSHTNDFWAKYAPYSETCEEDCQQLAARVYSLASFHPQVVNAQDELRRIVELGFTGVKFHPEYQNFSPNDSIMDPIWSKMSDLGLVLYLHAGGERVFKAPYHSSPKDIALLKRRFPDLEIVAAHLGGFGMWDEAEREVLGKAVNLDLSHTFFWMDEARIMRFIENHSPERLLFGSDAPWQDPGLVLGAFDKLDLAEDIRSKILFDNAERLLLRRFGTK